MPKKIIYNIPKLNLIFDFDGVIVNSHKVKTLAFYNIFKTYGKNYGLRAQRFHLKNTGKSRYFKFNYILQNIVKLKVTKKLIMKLDQEFDMYVESRIKKIIPSNHLISFLKNKKRSYNMYISTGTPQRKIEKILKEKKLITYFKKIYGSPKLKIEHIRDIKKNGKKCIFIGDSLEDFNAARNAGIEFILKINSENIQLRKKINIKKINSFKSLEKKINLLN
tara:strand:- start:477 stop:1139 length:663 start_codon:yes stop_codon:yes gene_type:complete